MINPPQVKLGLITIASGGGYAQKRYFLDGKDLAKDPTHTPNVWKGTFENVTVSDLEGFSDLLKKLKPDQVITLGTSKVDGKQPLVSSKRWSESSGAIARTKKFLTYGSDTHLLLLDHDGEPGKPKISADELWRLIQVVVPELDGCGRVVTASTSSHIYNSITGECYRGDTGHHTYILVRGDVERFVEILKIRFWLKGYAFFKLANPNKQTGVMALLERFLIDLTVFSAERLIFETGAALGEGLEQRRPDPNVYPGNIIDLDAIPEPTEQERAIAEANRAKARTKLRAEQHRLAVKHLTSEGLTRDQAEKEAQRRIYECENGFLRPSHKLFLADGTVITAGELNETHVGVELFDPQEPDYDGGRVVAKIFWTKSGVVISSFAHGQKKYRVVEDADNWQIDPIIFQSKPPSGLTSKEIKQWRSKQARARAKQQFRKLTRLDVEQEFVADWVNEAGIPAPKPGEAVLIDAPTGTGKSTWFKELVELLSKDGKVYADLNTHRNTLARATGSKMGMDHIADVSIPGMPQMNEASFENSERLAYCIDSLLKRVSGLLRHIYRGGKVLLVLDELHALLEHLLTTTTIPDVKRLSLIANFSILLQAIGEGNGWVIGGEAHLSYAAVECLRALSNGKITIKTYRVQRQNVESWDVFTYCYSLSQLNVATTDKVRALLAEGKRVLLMTGSKEAGEHYQVLYQQQYRVKRIDSDTIAEEDTFQFVKTLNESVRRESVQLLIASPSLGIGYDIDGFKWDTYFDAVVVNASAMDPFTVLQMAGRSRKPVARYLFMPGSSGGGKGTDPKKLLATWENSEKRLEAYELKQYQRRKVIDVALEATANFKAVRASGKSACYDVVRSLLADDGHNLIDGEILDKDSYNELADYYQHAHQELIQQRLAEYKGAAMFDSVDEAREVKDRDDVQRKDRVRAIKTLDYDKYGDRIHEDDFVVRIFCEGWKSKEFKRSYDNAVMFENPDLAKSLDKDRLINSLEKTGTFWAAANDDNKRLALMDLLIDLEFNEVLDHVLVNRYSQDDEVLQRFVERCKGQSERIYELTELTISDKTPIISFVNDFLRKNFAYESKSTLVAANPKKRGRKKKDDFNSHTLGLLIENIKEGQVYANLETPTKRDQKRVYQAVAFPYRDEIIARLKEREEERLAKSEKDRQASGNISLRSLPFYNSPSKTPVLRSSEAYLAEAKDLTIEFNASPAKTDPMAA